MISAGNTIRAVLGTNVLVSAFIRPKGVPAQVRRAGGEGRFTIVISDVLLNEARDVLARPRVRKAGHYAAEQAADFLDLLALTADIVPGPFHAPPVLATDPDDDWILATACEGEVDGIISGDKELLDLGSHEGIPIMTPAAFLEELKIRNP